MTYTLTVYKTYSAQVDITGTADIDTVKKSMLSTMIKYYYLDIQQANVFLGDVDFTTTVSGSRTYLDLSARLYNGTLVV